MFIEIIDVNMHSHPTFTAQTENCKQQAKEENKIPSLIDIFNANWQFKVNVI